MTHLLNLENLQFALKNETSLYTGVLYYCKLGYVCLISWPKIGVHVLERNFQAAHWPRVILGQIFLSPVNLTDFPLEQQTVPNVLRPKCIAKTSELPQDTLTVALMVGGHGSGFVSVCHGQSLVFFCMIQSPKVLFLLRDLAIPIV